ncbi:MAG: hypothetical protein Q9184_000843 [Pyrenodesmia sp. 2 TL-2023]
MPALSTTKRKFHAILESISNPSSTSLNLNNDHHNNASTTTLPTLTEPAAKRLKYARPTSMPVSSSNLTRTIRSASNTSNRRTSAASSMTEVKKPPPNFAPWDRNQFLARLETFRHVDKWMSKPDPINEVQWTKRGWTCVGKERVGCVGGCGNEVLISLEPDREEERPIEGIQPAEEAVDDYYDWREEAQKELVVRYNSIHRIPLANQATTLQSLRQRYESLSALSSSLPSNISTPPNFNISRLIPHLFHILHPSLEPTASTSHPSSPTTNPAVPNETNDSASSPPPASINPRALTLALLGWGADPTSPVPGILSCPACFRRVGLWLFKSPPSSPATSPPSSPTSNTSPTRSAPVINRLDPITEHRTYCPWINARSQARNAVLTDEDLSGWETLMDMILRVRMPEGVKVPGYEKDKEGSGEGGVGGMDGVQEKSKEERDKERWARLKKIKQIFKLRRKPKGNEEGGGKGKGK